MAKILYRWDDGKFEEEYLRKLERNLKGGVMSRMKEVDLNFSYFYFLFNLCSFILFLELGLGLE